MEVRWVCLEEFYSLNGVEEQVPWCVCFNWLLYTLVHSYIEYLDGGDGGQIDDM